MFVIIPLFVNATVICFVGAELVGVIMGKVGANQLLIASALSGLLTILSFKLSKEALLHLDADAESRIHSEEQVADKA